VALRANAEQIILQMNLQEEIDMESLILQGRLPRPAQGEFSIPRSCEELRAHWQSRLDRGEIGVARLGNARGMKIPGLPTIGPQDASGPAASGGQGGVPTQVSRYRRGRSFVCLPGPRPSCALCGSGPFPRGWCGGGAVRIQRLSSSVAQHAAR
jgi:hypothetical protein